MIVPGARDANWQDAEYTIILMTPRCELRSQQLHTYIHYYCSHIYAHTTTVVALTRLASMFNP